MYVWNPINDDHDDYLHIQPVSPRHAFQPLLDDFRGLHRLTLPDHQFITTNPKYESTQHETTALCEAEAKMWQAMCGLADLYLECGWDVNAVTQTSFRSSQFIETRTEYVQDVIEPLEAELTKATEDVRKPYRG